MLFRSHQILLLLCEKRAERVRIKQIASDKDLISKKIECHVDGPLAVL
jgi:hypothetical protein